MATKTAKTAGKTITLEATEHIKRLLRPAIAARRAWLECYRDERPDRERDNLTNEEWVARYIPFFRKLREIEWRLSQVIQETRWVVREWVCEQPAVAREREPIDKVVCMIDGVPIVHKTCGYGLDTFQVMLSGKDVSK